MELTPLTAISPIDGRYRHRTRELANWFSEQALIRARLSVELAYFEFLCRIPLPEIKGVDPARIARVRARIDGFTTEDARAVKEIGQLERPGLAHGRC